MKKSFTAKSKIWKVMKICAVQGMMAMILCGMSVAHDNYAQLLDRQVTLSLKEVSLELALREIGVSTNVKIFYSLDQYKLELSEQVSVEAIEEPLRVVLDKLLNPYHIKYKVYEKEATIILRKREQSSNQVDSRVYEPTLKVEKGQHINIITGKVTDAATQQPMAGVNVVIKGTTSGTTTNSEGLFAINSEDDDILVFSFIGYASFEIQASGRSTIDVALQEDIKSLNEVVVNAGYWEVKDSERTGNIAKLQAEEIEKQPVSNPLQALQGRIPGLYIQQQSGIPGGGFTVRIRGQNSLRSDGNEPLYIIDGVPYNGSSFAGSASSEIIPDGNPFNALSPGDIESIEVLKDADATAIYGSRGANGVVLISTKKGKAEKTHVDVGVYQGISQVSHFMDLLNTPAYIGMRREAFRNDGVEPGAADVDLTLWDTTRYTDWQRDLIGGTAHTTNAKVSVSGGTKDTQFLIGGGYFRQSTVFPGSFNDQKISGHINLNHMPADEKFGLTFSSSYVNDNNNLLRQDITRYITLPPNTPIPYDEYGKLNWENSTWENPYAILERPYEGRTSNLITSLGLKYELLKGLNLKASLGFTDTQTKEFSSFPIDTWMPGYGITTGSSVFSSNSITTWNVEPQIEYQRLISRGILSLLAGTTFLQNARKGEDIEASGFTSDAMLKNKMAASTLSIINARDIIYRYNAVFGRINFNWDKKYLINLTARRDGSSRFGPEHRFANFGAIGAAWIFTNEPFFQDNMVLSFGKIRSSYGVTGSDQIGDYQYLDSYRSTFRTYQGQSGLIPSRLANPNYSWESNKKFEAALDLGFFKNRIQLSASWFRNRSSNQLVGLPLPSITGFTSVQYNFPATVQNLGLELMLESVNVENNDFSWTTSLNLTFPKNKLVSYPNLEGSPYATTYEVGKSLYAKKLFHYTQVDPQTGLITFEDKNENGSGTDYPDDLQTLKEVSQQYYGGLQNSISYKGFHLSFFIQFVKQTGYSYITSSNFYAPGRQGNQMREVMDRWQNPGDISAFQKFTNDYATEAGGLYSTSTYAGDNSITDASFIRFQNVYLAWEFPKAWIRKGLRDAKLYFQGQNILTITNYKGLSPETQNQSVLPPLRTLTLGFQFSL